MIDDIFDPRRVLGSILGAMTNAGDLTRLGTVISSYTSGRPRITFDGDELPSQVGLPYADGLLLAGGDRVLLLKVGTLYVVICKIAP